MEDIEEMLKKYKREELDLEEVKSAILNLPYADLEDVKVDTFRVIRKGLPEAVYCSGKTAEQLKKIAGEGDRIFTRADEEHFEIVSSVREDVVYNEEGRLIVVGDLEQDVDAEVSVVTAGSSDIPIAEEAAGTLDVMGYEVKRIFDVGVAGIHRLFPQIEELREADAVIVVAGMDGVLPGIVAGMVPTPVIGVPTSVGYGVSEDGKAALETMLSSCSTGLSVVNIDNGYGAAAFVHHMLG